MDTCLLDVAGTPWKLIARDWDIPDLPEGQQVWISCPPESTIAVPRD